MCFVFAQLLEMDYSQYIGKYVHYILPDGTLTGGIVEYFGPNPIFPEFGIQITIDRCPYRNVDPSKVSIKPLPESWYGSEAKYINNGTNN